MIDSVNVSKIMTKEVLTLDAADPLLDAQNAFQNHHIRHAPVLSNGELVGMLSEVDLQKLPPFDMPNTEGFDENDFIYNQLTVARLMTSNPISVQSSASIKEVAKILSENEFHALPVLKNSEVVGIISTTDLIRFLMENM